MLQVIEKLGMHTSFICMIRLLFQDATIFVDIDNQRTQPFGIHQGVCQGCHLAPYLFIIVAEELKVEV
jgi:hypothetical protein